MKIKKLLIVISMLAVMFSLTACEDADKPFDYDESDIVLQTMEYFTTYLNVDDDYAEYYLTSGTDFEQSAIKGIDQAQNTDKVGAFEDYSVYNDALDDGSFDISMVNAEIINSSDSVAVTVTNKAENRDVEITITYKENSEYYITMDQYVQTYMQYYAAQGYTEEVILATSGCDTLSEAFGVDEYLQQNGIYPYEAEEMVVSAVYSTGELMEQAGLNTLIGMGTVFVVLIFISFIISLFKFLPALLAKKPEVPVEAKKKVSTPVAASAPVVAEQEELINDTELVAVITAAVYAAAGASSAVSKDGLVVRSIKRARRK